MKKIRMLTSIVATVMLLSGLALAPVSAEIAGDGYVYLLDSNATTYNATTDWRAYVSIPTYFTLEDTYWNFTVYLEPVNNTGRVYAKNPSFNVDIYINDGLINRTVTTGTIAESKTARVYSNLSITTDITLFTANDSALLYFRLQNSTTTNDTYVCNFIIAEDAMGGTVAGLTAVMIPLAISIVVIQLIGSMISGGMLGLNQRSSSGTHHHKKGKRHHKR